MFSSQIIRVVLGECFGIGDEDEDGDDEEKEESDELGSEADFFLNDLVPFSMEYYLDLQKLSAINDEAIDEDEDEDEDEKPKKKK